MKQYEVTFIVDPVLSGEEIKATAQTYVDLLKNEDCEIINVDEMGLKQLAYPINRRTSGVYFCIEFQSESEDIIDKLELALRRDERIIRFLTVRLDKFGIKYNQDKRDGLIGKVKKKDKKDKDNRGRSNNRNRGDRDRRDRDKGRDDSKKDRDESKKERDAKPAPKPEPKQEKVEKTEQSAPVATDQEEE
ncbi:MAG: 30S ribosomal protein S6 [Bacteroidota bacterium]